MSEFDQLYREVILDHYKNPRGHGLIEDADAEAEGQNPLCGDEVSIYVVFGEDGGTIDEVKFSGRGRDPAGRHVDADRARAGPQRSGGRDASARGAARRDRHPVDAGAFEVRMLGLSTPKLALHKAKGTPLPEEWAGASSDLELN